MRRGTWTTEIYPCRRVSFDFQQVVGRYVVCFRTKPVISRMTVVIHSLVIYQTLFKWGTDTVVEKHKPNFCNPTRKTIQTHWKLSPNVWNISVCDMLHSSCEICFHNCWCSRLLLDSDVNDIFILHIQLLGRFASFQLVSIKGKLESWTRKFSKFAISYHEFL